MIEPVDPAGFELLHMLMACANSASAIFEFYGPISPVARNFESIFKYVPFTSFYSISNLLALRKAVRAFC